MNVEFCEDMVDISDISVWFETVSRHSELRFLAVYRIVTFGSQHSAKSAFS